MIPFGTPFCSIGPKAVFPCPLPDHLKAGFGFEKAGAFKKGVGA